MQLIKRPTDIKFMSHRKLALTVSMMLIAISLASLVFRGLNYGIDFTGGTLIEVSYAEPVELGAVRSALAQSGFERALTQHFGTSHDVLIRLVAQDRDNRAGLSNEVLKVLQQQSPGQLEMRRVEFVGPQVGEELREDGGLAILYALVGILIYVWLRFEWRFSIGSVIALIHDVTLTLGFFSITQVEFNLTVLAALLAVIGYSLNDTIVVFDRIREDFRKMRKASSTDVINAAINQMLGRTLMTSLTTMLVLVALFFLGGEIIHGFALALIIGVIVGTYSSIYIASTSMLMMGVSKADLMPVKKEGAADERP